MQDIFFQHPNQIISALVRGQGELVQAQLQAAILTGVQAILFPGSVPAQIAADPQAEAQEPITEPAAWEQLQRQLAAEVQQYATGIQAAFPQTLTQWAAPDEQHLLPARLAWLVEQSQSANIRKDETMGPAPHLPVWQAGPR